MSRVLPRGIVAIAIALTLACAGSRPWETPPSPASDLPSALELEGPEPAVGGCAGRLRDPRGGVLLILRRSIGGRAPSGGPLGDYAVTPQARYGGSLGRLLRVDCGTGRPLGLVPG